MYIGLDKYRHPEGHCICSSILPLAFLPFSSIQMRFSSAYFLRMDKLRKTKDEEANLESQSFKYKNQKPNVSIREKTALDDS